MLQPYLKNSLDRARLNSYGEKDFELRPAIGLMGRLHVLPREEILN